MRFTINNQEYLIDSEDGLYWWSSRDDEMTGFGSALEAQQSAITHEAMIIRDREADLAERLEDECFGTFREQVDALYHSTRL